MLLLYCCSIISKLPKFLVSLDFFKNKIILTFQSFELLPLFFFLKNHTFTQYSQLLDLTAVDVFSKQHRFALFYQLISLRYNHRLMLRTNLFEYQSVQSLVDIYRSSIWLEREVWDMFGVFFSGNNDLRRILTDYGFQGFPLRKDFPLSGFLELFYNEDSKKVSYCALELSQEFRFFDFKTPWDIC